MVYLWYGILEKYRKMLEFSQMVSRFLVALALGALMGVERELVGKEAGTRTAMLVSGGAALFTIISLEMPAVFGIDPGNLAVLSDRVISNIVVGIGFLGAGIIIKTGEGHVRGLTTAAVVWATAAVGTLAGLGLAKFALVSALTMSGLLYFLRRIRLYERLRPDHKVHND